MSSESPTELVLSRLKNVRSSGDTGRQWTACCPAHEDGHSSLAIGKSSEDVVLLKCYAGCDLDDILRAISLERKDLYPEGTRAGKKGTATAAPDGVTVNRLAFEKRIPAEWLRTVAGLSETRGRYDDWNVVIPYRGIDGADLYKKYRSKLSSRNGFYHDKGTTQTLYGLWLKPAFVARGKSLILVEGESDCWALWYHDFNAYGVPGAAAEKTISAEMFDGFDTVYVWQEPGEAGAKFPGRVGDRLRTVGYAGQIFVASLEGAKDPADIQAKQGDLFSEFFRKVLAAAKPWQGPAAVPVDVIPQQVRRAEKEIKAAGCCDWGEFDLTERGNAGRLEKLYGADLRYLGEKKEWYVWNGQHWGPDLMGSVGSRIDLTVLSLVHEAQAAPTRSGQNDCIEWYRRSQAARAHDAINRLARSMGRIPASRSAFDTHPMLFNCPNGTIDLTTGELRPHRREDLLTAISPTEFDADATCPAWDRFLAAIFPADPADPTAGGNVKVIQYVRRLLGYCLTGDTRVHAMPIFWGGGSNGKSTLLEVVQDVIGTDYSGPAPDDFLMVRQHQEHLTEIADLQGKRLVIATETDQGKRLNEARVKKLTGGDTLKARFMKENLFRFRATHKLILCTNHRPQVRGTDRGIWRRLLLVPFVVQFWDPDKGETGPAHLKQDKELKDKLTAEAPGILASLVRGCVEWLEHGLQQPQDVRKVTEDYQHEEDVIGRFLDERYRKAADATYEYLKVIHAKFCEWCEENGERAVSNKILAAELRNRGFDVKNGAGNKVCVFGIGPATFDGDDL